MQTKTTIQDLTLPVEYRLEFFVSRLFGEAKKLSGQAQRGSRIE